MQEILGRVARSHLIFLTLLTGTAARAELGYVSLKELTQSSELIACAYIYNVQYIGKEKLEKEFGRTLPHPGLEVAQAVILRPIKGTNLAVGQRIAIAGYSTWMCDATRVSKGERAIFFLDSKDNRNGADIMAHFDFDAERRRKTNNVPLYFIAASGQGKRLETLASEPFAFNATYFAMERQIRGYLPATLATKRPARQQHALPKVSFWERVTDWFARF